MKQCYMINTPWLFSTLWYVRTSSKVNYRLNYLPTYLTNYLSINQSTYLSNYLSICTYQSISLSIYLRNRTVDKIGILGYDSLPELEKYLSPDNFPSSLSLSIYRTNYYFFNLFITIYLSYQLLLF